MLAGRAAGAGPVRGGNAFQLGLFGANCESGLAITRAPDRWHASWANNVAAARLAESAGLEFMLPIARWHGYRGAANAQGSNFETMAWAAGLLGATSRIAVFATIHVPFLNPVFAAKQSVTIQAIGDGRFGLNIVAGANAPEFAMFGVPFHDHDARYDHVEEWLTIVKRIWSDSEPFDFDGKYFQLRDVIGEPRPATRPRIISAGSSGVGRAFALRHADALFMNIVALDTLSGELASLRAGAPDATVYASGHVMCRPTSREAREFHHYIVHEMGDWQALEHILKLRESQHTIPMDRLVRMKERLLGGIGTFPIIGDPDAVAAQFAELHAAGIDGMAIGFIDYLAEVPFFQAEVLPRLERLGLRQPAPELARP